MKKNWKWLFATVCATPAVAMPMIAISCTQTIDQELKKVTVDVENKGTKVAKDIKTSDIKTSGFNKDAYDISIDKVEPEGETGLKVTLTLTEKSSGTKRTTTLTISGFKKTRKTPDTPKEQTITEQEYDFKNYDDNYTIKEGKIKGYYKGDKKNLFVDPDQFVKTLSGLFDLKSYKVEWDEATQTLQMTTLIHDGRAHKLIFDAKNGTISSDTGTDAFNFTKSSQRTNYDQFVKQGGEKIYHVPKPLTNLVFDLKKYGLEMINHKDKDGKNKVLIPYSVFNTLFCSQNYYNTYFNGTSFFGVDYAGNDRDSEWLKLKKGAFSGTEAPEEIRKETLAHLNWAMDYFYGLRNHKNITDFGKTLSDDIKKKILSRNVKDNNDAYLNIFHKTLDELHTRMTSTSAYASENDNLLSSEYEERLSSPARKEHTKVRKQLAEQRKNRNLSDDEKMVRFHNDMAIITLNSFTVGTIEQLKGPDAWKHDSYSYMKKAMEKIEEYNKKNGGKIKKVILDLSLNGGGTIVAMWKVIGFMTNKPIYMWDQEILNQWVYERYANIDTNGDDKYDDKDGFPQYKWYVLSGINTFSAANQMVSLVRNQGFAKVIGQKSGGGMSAILPLVLADGTNVTISSNYVAVVKDKNPDGTVKWTQIEGGVDPDAKFDYSKFSDDASILNAVDQVEKAEEKGK